MRRLHWAFILSMLTTGPVLAQISYPNCSAGWEWVSFSKFLYIGAIPAPDHGPILSSRTTVSTKVRAMLPRTWRLRAMVAVSWSLRPSFDTLRTWLSFHRHTSEFNIPALPSGRQYAGPASSQHYPCQCNTVVYSLVSACGDCQESSWILYAFNLNPQKIHADDILLLDGPHGHPIVPVWLLRR